MRRVRGSLGARTVAGLFRGLPLTLQRGPSRGWRARYHFDLTRTEPYQGTVVLDDGTLEVLPGLQGPADVEVRGDGAAWLQVASGRRGAVWAILTRALRVRGDLRLLNRFARCFPR